MMEAGNSNLVTVSCADHKQYVAIALGILFDSKRGTDFVFRLGSQSVRAHKLIVELFLAQESTGTAQNELRDPLAVKQEVPGDGYGSGVSILDFVMEFIYKGVVSVPEQHLEELLGVAKELDFQMMIDAIQACMPVDISTEDEINIDEGLQEPWMEDVQCNREIFGHAENLQRLDTLTPRSVTLKQQISDCDQISRTLVDSRKVVKGFQSGLVHPSLVLKSENCEISNSKPLQLEPNCIKPEPGYNSDPQSPLEDVADSWNQVLPSSGSDEDDDGGAPLDDLLYPTTSNFTPNNKSDTLDTTRLYNCPHCDFETPQYTRHVTHLVRVHGLNTKGKPAPKFTCPHCDFQTSYRTKYLKHCRSVHQLTMRGEPAPLHKCPKCDYSTVYSASLRLHLETKHSQVRNHACPQCNYVAKLKCHLKDHLDRVHGVGGFDFTCKICRKPFGTRVELERHVRTHANDRPYGCPRCCYAANAMQGLKKHLSVVHGEGDSRFTCKVCRMRCKTRCALERHTKTHSSERPFKCPHCSFDSNHEMSLKRHVRNAHFSIS